jgi:lipoic acid synthetase
MNTRPDWIKADAPGPSSKEKVGDKLDELGINTVCREANCPNQGECWGNGTATFMLMGDTCTRNCRFCDVRTGNPGGYLDGDEPGRLKEIVDELGLDYVVLTSVDRDDLRDGGAEHFEKAVKAIKEIPDAPPVEGLIPDFSGETGSIELVARSGLEVLGHNIETVERLSPEVRDPRAGYSQSLSVLDRVKEIRPDLVTKSSLMLGLGEKRGEVVESLKDLYRVGVDIVTIGQYLRPTKDQLPVQEFLDSSEFNELERVGEEIGFTSVVAGPFVRSSYKAKETYLKAQKSNRS